MLMYIHTEHSAKPSIASHTHHIHSVQCPLVIMASLDLSFMSNTSRFATLPNTDDMASTIDSVENDLMPTHFQMPKEMEVSGRDGMAWVWRRDGVAWHGLG